MLNNNILRVRFVCGRWLLAALFVLFIAYCLACGFGVFNSAISYY